MTNNVFISGICDILVRVVGALESIDVRRRRLIIVLRSHCEEVKSEGSITSGIKLPDHGFRGSAFLKYPVMSCAVARRVAPRNNGTPAFSTESSPHATSRVLGNGELPPRRNAGISSTLLLVVKGFVEIGGS